MIAAGHAGFGGVWLNADFDCVRRGGSCAEVIDIPIAGGFPTSAFTALGLESGALAILTGYCPARSPCSGACSDLAEDNFAGMLRSTARLTSCQMWMWWWPNRCPWRCT